jgi:hypothetical protein
MVAPMDIATPLMNDPNVLVRCLEVFADEETRDACGLSVRCPAPHGWIIEGGA